MSAPKLVRIHIKCNNPQKVKDVNIVDQNPGTGRMPHPLVIQSNFSLDRAFVKPSWNRECFRLGWHKTWLKKMSMDICTHWDAHVKPYKVLCNWPTLPPASLTTQYRLSYVNLFLKFAIQEASFDVQLVYLPSFVCSWSAWQGYHPLSAWLCRPLGADFFLRLGRSHTFKCCSWGWLKLWLHGCNPVVML